MPPRSVTTRSSDLPSHKVMVPRSDPEASKRNAEEALRVLKRRPDPDLEIRARLLLCDYRSERDSAGAQQEIAAAAALPTAYATAQYALFSAPGRPSLVVPTRPIPDSIGLPSGRFFIVRTPGRGNVTWRVTLKDADGHVVPFASF